MATMTVPEMKKFIFKSGLGITVEEATENRLIKSKSHDIPRCSDCSNPHYSCMCIPFLQAQRREEREFNQV